GAYRRGLRQTVFPKQLFHGCERSHRPRQAASHNVAKLRRAALLHFEHAEAQQLDREVEHEAVGGALQRAPGQFLELAQPVQQRMAVEMQRAAALVFALSSRYTSSVPIRSLRS